LLKKCHSPGITGCGGRTACARQGIPPDIIFAFTFSAVLASKTASERMKCLLFTFYLQIKINQYGNHYVTVFLQQSHYVPNGTFLMRTLSAYFLEFEKRGEFTKKKCNSSSGICIALNR
jgi:hypothetical protein